MFQNLDAILQAVHNSEYVCDEKDSRSLPKCQKLPQPMNFTGSCDIPSVLLISDPLPLNLEFLEAYAHIVTQLCRDYYSPHLYVINDEKVNSRSLNALLDQ